MVLQPGMLWLTLVPAALCGGPWCGTAMLVLVAAALPFSKTLITNEQRASLMDLGHEYVSKLHALRSPRAKHIEQTHAT